MCLHSTPSTECTSCVQPRNHFLGGENRSNLVVAGIAAAAIAAVALVGGMWIIATS